MTDLRRENLGFIGMGRMGSRMAARLIGAGYGVTVYDRSKKKSQAAPLAQSPRDLAANSEVVLISVTDDAAVEQVMFAPDGALAGLKKRLANHRPEHRLSRRLAPSVSSSARERCGDD